MKINLMRLIVMIGCFGLCQAFGADADGKKADPESYRKAAEQGNSLAQYWLGVCYEGGNGVTKDLGMVPQSRRPEASIRNQASVPDHAVGSSVSDGLGFNCF